MTEVAIENDEQDSNCIDILIVGVNGKRYKSIDRIEWKKVPRFAVITGLNGSGKTQLLEIISHKLTGTLIPGIDLQNDIRVIIDGDTFPPESVAYLPSRLDITPASHVGIPQMQSAREQLWNELNSGHHSPHDIRAVTRRARLRSIIGPVFPPDPESFKKLLSDDYAFMLEDTDVVAGLAHVIVAHRLRQAEALEKGLNREEIQNTLGPAPWEVINEAFQVADFPYEVVSPLGTPISGIYELKLQSKLSLDQIPPGDLSSGEKMLLLLVLWLYNSQHHGRFPRLLLLDEPDAHLHPSMTRQFLDVVREVLVEKYGVRVIMTTHSPSTVALAPKGSVFEMSRSVPRIQPSPSISHTVGLLSAGLVVASPDSRIILVEDEIDVQFYNAFLDLLTDYGPSRNNYSLAPNPSLIFLPASRGGKSNKLGGGCTVVKQWVEKFSIPPLSEVIRGLIDKDKTNTPSPNIEVLGRYSIENYLLDPLVVYCLLSSAGEAPIVSGLGITTGDEHLIRSQPAAILSEIVSVIAKAVEKEIPDLTVKDRENRTVKFTNGAAVEYPAWVLERRGHTLMQCFQNAFGGAKVISPPRLELSLRRLRMIPKELADVFRRLQQGVSDIEKV